MKLWHVTVNRHRLAANRKGGEREPIFRVSLGRSGRPHYAESVAFPAGARLVYCLDRPLPCGASVWIEAPEVAS